MVKVVLAGMNVPMKILDDINALKKAIEEGKESDESKLEYITFQLGEIAKRFTPEILTAAYARISRKPEDVNQLVEEAYDDVPKARKSNQSIIYGMGHHSVADHALFNFNITGISRLAVEFLEKRRIGSGYTEKSQRYITLDGDYVKPTEFSPEDASAFHALVAGQNAFYFRNYPKIFDSLKNKFSGQIAKLDDKGKAGLINDLEGKTKEDARYSLSLATEAQLGCSFDGEALELTIREGKHDRLQEVRELAKQLYGQTVAAAPSLIQLTDPELFAKHNPGQQLLDDNFAKTPEHIRKLVAETFLGLEARIRTRRFMPDGIEFYRNLEELLSPTRIKCSDPDTNILAAILHTYSKKSASECYQAASILQHEKRAEDFKNQALKHMSLYDKLPREFESNNGLMFEAVVSASCFAQLKRHRMLTLLPQDYDTSLGFTMPPNIEEAGLGQELVDVVNKSSELHETLEPRYGKAAEFALTNAHRRRVLICTNMRELCHVSRTREDKHAQWEIRGLATQLSKLARDYAPITASVLGGQSELLKHFKAST